MRRYLILLMMLLARPCLAVDAEGAVSHEGVSLARRATIVPTSGDRIVLCKNDIGKRIGKIAGMHVLVSGEWQLEGSIKCLAAVTFKVKRLPSGRDALVGKLVRTPQGFAVEPVEGNPFLIGNVPSGLADLLGKNVIVDVKPLSMGDGQSQTWRVVSYTPLP